MSSGYTGGDPADAPSEEELRAAYEAEIKKIRVEQILLEQVVTLVNLGMRRTGLSPGTEDERDVEQVRLAIESIRALLPMIEQSAPPQAAAIRDALSQLQLAFVKLGAHQGPRARRPVRRRVLRRSRPLPGRTPVPARRRPRRAGRPRSAGRSGGPVSPAKIRKARRTRPRAARRHLWVPGQ